MPTRNSLESDFGNDIKTYEKLDFRARDFFGHVEQKFECIDLKIKDRTNWENNSENHTKEYLIIQLQT